MDGWAWCFEPSWISSAFQNPMFRLVPSRSGISHQRLHQSQGWKVWSLGVQVSRSSFQPHLFYLFFTMRFLNAIHHWNWILRSWWYLDLFYLIFILEQSFISTSIIPPPLQISHLIKIMSTVSHLIKSSFFKKIQSILRILGVIYSSLVNTSIHDSGRGLWKG